MADMTLAKESSFCQDEIMNVLKEIVDGSLQSNGYNADEIPIWNKDILQKTVDQLINLDKPFKYIVNSTIIDKHYAGLHSYSAGYWENFLDGCVTLKWENKDLFCVVNVYAISL